MPKLGCFFSEKILIIDDESYFHLSNTDLSDNAGYYTFDTDATPNEVKPKRKSKYDLKLLVFISLSEEGVSKRYIAPSGQAVDKGVYISKYLIELKKFINEIPKNDDTVLRPDIASAHFLNKVQNYLKGKNIKYVPREKYPAYVPICVRSRIFVMKLKDCFMQIIGKLKISAN